MSIAVRASMNVAEISMLTQAILYKNVDIAFLQETTNYNICVKNHVYENNYNPTEKCSARQCQVFVLKVVVSRMS